MPQPISSTGGTSSDPNRKMGPIEFGARLLELNDLDPVYVVLHEAQLEPDLLKRWLLSYFCFYHVGTASWIVDQSNYWAAMFQAAGSRVHPRSSERRHFRGGNAAKSVAYLKGRGIDNLFHPLLQPDEGSSRKLDFVMQRVQEWVGFGPWIAFKVADMLERLGLCRIEFGDGALYDSPRDGAYLMWFEAGQPTVPSFQSWAINEVIDRLSYFKAPPRMERPINAQEAETILCKFKSYRGEHYVLGEDVEACRQSLLRYSRSPTSQRLFQAGRGRLWDWS